MSDDEKIDEKNKDERIKEENEKLRKEIERLRREIEDLHKAKKKIEKEFEEYKFRHPDTVGVKHGKQYHIKEPTSTKPKGRPGADPVTKAISGRYPNISTGSSRFQSISVPIAVRRTLARTYRRYVLEPSRISHNADRP